MLNKVVLIGRFVKDPELRATQGGTSVASFTLAVDRDYKGQDGEKQTDFINCVAWKQTAEFISHWFKKGNLVCVEGSIQTRSWKDNDGNNRYATEVVVDRSHFVESKKEAAEQAEVETMPTESFAPLGQDDDLPF